MSVTRSWRGVTTASPASRLGGADGRASLPSELAQAAAASTSYLAALQAVRTLARVVKGETVLVAGDADGVGLAAIHVARRLGARVIAAPDAASSHLWRALGDGIVVCAQDRMCEQVVAAAGAKGVDVVLNFGEGRLATQRSAA